MNVNKKELQTLKDEINQLFSNKKTVSVAKSAAPASSSSPTRNDQEDSKDAEVTTDPAYHAPKPENRQREGYIPTRLSSLFPSYDVQRRRYDFTVEIDKISTNLYWRTAQDRSPQMYKVITRGATQRTGKDYFAYIPDEIKELVNAQLDENNGTIEEHVGNSNGVIFFTGKSFKAKIRTHRDLEPVCFIKKSTSDKSAELFVFDKTPQKHIQIKNIQRQGRRTAFGANR